MPEESMTNGGFLMVKRKGLMNAEKLDQKLAGIDLGAVVRHLRALPAPCYESTLLRIAFPDMEIASASPLDLYRNHFALFHLLYRLQEEFYQEGVYLHVHFMRVFLAEYPVSGKCRYYIDDTGQFCGADCAGENNYCPFHRNSVGESAVEALSIKYFYLDRDNFDRLDEKTAEAFLQGAWDLLTRYGEYEKSLSVLGIIGAPDLRTVKRNFRRLAMEHHPDRGAESHRRFNEINRAYRLLLRVIPG